MPRIRTIKPDFFLDQDIAKLPPLYRIAFVGLWCCADKAGRMEDRPDLLKWKILPYDKTDFNRVLCALSDAQFIARYEVNGRKYIEIRTFARHQRPHHTERDSPIPPYNGSQPVVQPLCNPKEEEEEREEEEEERKNKVISAEPEKPGSSPTIAANLQGWLLATDYLKPLADQKHARFWAKCEGLYDQYRWLFFEEEIRKADLWITNHAQRRPTERGLPRFMASWLERAVDYGRRRNAEGEAPAAASGKPHPTRPR